MYIAICVCVLWGVGVGVASGPLSRPGRYCSFWEASQALSALGVHSQTNIPFKKLLTVQDIFAVFGGFISFLLIQGLLKCVLQTRECDSRRVGVCALTYNRVLACVLTDVYVYVFIYMSYIYSAVAFLHTCKALYTYIYTQQWRKHVKFHCPFTNPGTHPSLNNLK